MDNPCIALTAKTDYVNCRATSPRSVDVHGAFSVRLQVTAEGGSEVVTSVRGEGIYTRNRPVSYTVPAAFTEKQFTVSEVLELGQGMPEAEMLIRGEAVPVLEDCKLMANKAIIKGELRLKNLYVSDPDTGASHVAQNEIPFSQIVDVDGLTDEWICDVELETLVNDVHISVNQTGKAAFIGECQTMRPAAMLPYRNLRGRYRRLFRPLPASFGNPPTAGGASAGYYPHHLCGQTDPDPPPDGSAKWWICGARPRRWRSGAKAAKPL